MKKPGGKSYFVPKLLFREDTGFFIGKMTGFKQVVLYRIATHRPTQPREEIRVSSTETMGNGVGGGESCYSGIVKLLPC